MSRRLVHRPIIIDPYYPARRPQTGAGFWEDFDVFLRDSKILSTIGGAAIGAAGTALGGPIAGAAAGGLGGYALRQTGYGKKRKKAATVRNERSSSRVKKRKTKRK